MIQIKWAEFALVFGAALAATVAITLSYSGFIRLLSVARADGRTTSPAPMAGAVLCLAVCAAAVLFGLWLIIPQFHSS